MHILRYIHTTIDHSMSRSFVKVQEHRRNLKLARYSDECERIAEEQTLLSFIYKLSKQRNALDYYTIVTI